MFFCSNVTQSQSGWFEQHLGYSGNLNQVFFLNLNTGFVTSNYYPNKVFKTNNSGNNWLECFSSNSHSFRTILFVTNDVGYILGWDNPNHIAIIKTTNGGDNWNII